jgi:hypothetical protein
VAEWQIGDKVMLISETTGEEIVAGYITNFDFECGEEWSVEIDNQWYWFADEFDTYQLLPIL